MSHLCPSCHERPLDTVATLPYVRGFLIAYQIGTKKFLGCRSCVRGSIFKEVGLSALIGWFSITALVINPFMIVYGIIRGIVVKPDPEGVHRVLVEAGVPLDEEDVDFLRVTYGLAAAMIAADGKIEASEVATASRIGAQLFPTFDAGELSRHLQNPKEIPDPGDLASLLADVLDDEQKQSIYRYLEAIAAADGNVSSDEQAMLQRVQTNLGLRPQLHAA
jgi:uncharacterized tellurite resistance protein B-like protein